MNKRIKILLISILLFALGTGVVNASVATATLSTSSQTVKPGETFTVTLTAKCDQGINGLEGKIDYDKEKLEILEEAKVKVKIVDTTAWTNLGENLTVQILHSSNETVKEAEIFKITFKVKEDAAVDSTAKITFNDIVLDSEEGTNSRNEIEAQAIEVKIVKEAGNNENDDEDKDDEDKDDEDKDDGANDNEGADKDDEANNNDGTNKNDGANNNDGTNKNDGINNNNTIKNNNTNATGKNNVDTTTSDKSYPKTGVVTILLPILIISLISVILYKKYKEF